MSARTHMVLVSELVPVRVTVTVVGLVQPEATVVLPLSPGARPTTVIAGALPVPWYAIVIVKCVLSVMANPVAVTLATVLAALKLSEEPSLKPEPAGPVPLKLDHWPLVFVAVFCCDGLLAAKALLSPYPTAPAPSPTSNMTSTTDRVEMPLRIVD
jgi:hypothetical protein